MYQDKLAVAIKHNGKVLREVKQPGSELTDTVLLPLGSEYSILIKNLNSVRAQVTISVDGTPVTDGISLIVPANDELEVERFVKAGELERGHRLKFIERTEKIENGPRGARAEDGLLRVEFEFEAPNQYTTPSKLFWYGNPAPHTGNLNTLPCTTSTFSLKAADFTCDSWSGHRGVPYSSIIDATSSSVASSALSTQPQVGITVPGSASEQKFVETTAFFSSGIKHTLVLRLLGRVSDEPVTAPVTVKTKLECPTCGTKNSSMSKFCGECGTALFTWT